MKTFTIRADEAGQRLDKYLKKLLPEASAGFIYKMLRKKNITYNGRKAAGNELLQPQDSVKLFFSDETYGKFASKPEAVQKEYEMLKNLPMEGLKVIYEDTDILIADKPHGMLSQKAAAADLSANEYLLGYLIQSGSLTAEQYAVFHPSVCNRLDRNTSGLLLMGKSLKGSQELSSALKNRSMKKYYHALVKGRIEKEAHLSGCLVKDEKNNKVHILPKGQEGAAYIETAYRPLAFGTDFTLLEVHLITGKTHQIRAHLASVGHPLMGDSKYGDRAWNQKYRKNFHVDHQLLHAYRIEFADGRTFTAEEPELFSVIMKNCKE